MKTSLSETAAFESISYPTLMPPQRGAGVQERSNQGFELGDDTDTEEMGDPSLANVYDERVLMRQLGFKSARPAPIESVLKPAVVVSAMGPSTGLGMGEARSFGCAPEWLIGSYYILVPSAMDIKYLGTKWSWFGRVTTESRKQPFEYWHDSLCMLVKVEFSVDGQVMFKSHLVAPKALEQWRAAQGDPERLDGKKITQALHGARKFSWFWSSPKGYDVDPEAAVLQSSINTNFSMGQYHGGDQRLALHQSGSPLIQVIDGNTLHPRSLIRYSDINKQFNGFPCPNPVVDPLTGGLVNVLVEYSTKGKGRYSNYADYHVVSLGGMATGHQKDMGHLIGTFKALPVNLEYFTVTQDYVIVPIPPLTYKNGLPDLGANLRTGWKEKLVFEPDRDTLFYVVDKRLGFLVAVYRSEACYVHSIINSFQEKNEIIIDIVTQEVPPLVEEDKLSNLRCDDLETIASRSYPQSRTVRRYTLCNLSEEMARFDGAAGQLNYFPLANFLTVIEYSVTSPSINLQFGGVPYRFAYGLSVNKENRSGSGFLPNSIVKCDLRAPLKSIQWYKSGHFPIVSPTFVPNTENPLGREDDGILLTVITSVLTRRSYLYVFDSKDLSILAQYELPGHNPLPLCQVPGAWQSQADITLTETSFAARAPIGQNFQ